MSVQAGDICVAHLVRRSKDASAFRTFVESYLSCPAGVSHDLLVIFKGFSGPAELAPYNAILQSIPHKRVFVRDFGFDVRPYVKVARDFPYRYFAYFNSFSKLLVPGWLEALFRQAGRRGIGLAGATGSYQSLSSDFDVYRWKVSRSLPAFKRALFPWLRYLRYLITIRGRYPAYPNYHIRTNGFMVGREIMANLRYGPMLQKWDAYRFESGAASMTRQIMSAGLIPVVVGADGRAYDPPEWPDAKTFWIADQQNLLVSDNQTRAFSEGTPALRERLAFDAWRRRPDGTPREDVPALPE